MNDDLSPTEQRLRDALAAEAASIEPSSDGLRRIEEKLMTDTTSAANRTRYYVLGGVAAAIVLVAGLLIAFGGGNDDDSEVATGSTETTNTTESTTTSTTADGDGPFAPTTDPSLVVYPAIDSSQRFDSPEAVTYAFLTEYAEFTDPVISDFQQGDSRSGEVSVTPDGSGPTSTVLVRQLEDDTWGVIGAEHEGITPEKPENDATITSPVGVAGSGLAFEGSIKVDVREQGRITSIGEGVVTAGGMSPGAPYSGQFEFSSPETEFGAIMYREFSPKDGSTAWVAITRVSFAGAGTSETAAGCPDSAQPGPDAGNTVLVYFSCMPDTVGPPVSVAVTRPNGATAGVLRFALEALFEGPTDAEAASGLESPFPVPGGGVEIRGLTVADGLATIDLGVDQADLLATGDTLYGAMLTSQIVETAAQFSTVDRVRLLFNGSCDEFAAWAAAGPGDCTTRP